MSVCALFAIIGGFSVRLITDRSDIASGVPRNVFGVEGFARNFFRGVQQIHLRTEGRENGDLGAVAPSSGVPLNLQMSEPRILIGLLRMYFPQISEFGSSLELWGGGVDPTQTAPRYGTGHSV
jgi:hypothetical protein